MAEVLIKAVDARNRDPAKDARGCYERGDPVVAKPDGWNWGKRERLPKFFRVRIPNVSPTYCQAYCESQYAGLILDQQPKIVRRRRWQMLPELLPPEKRRQLLRGQIVELSWEEWQRVLHDKAAQPRRLAA